MSCLESAKQIPGSREIAVDTQLFDPANLVRESHGPDVAGGRFQPVANGGGLAGGRQLQRAVQLRQGLGGAGLEEADELHKEIGRSLGRQAPQFCDYPGIDPGERVFHDSYLNPRLTPIGSRHLL